MVQYRQGDVFITEIDEKDIPQEAYKQKAKPEDGRLILAEGEATGHNHSISSRAGDLLGWSNASVRYLRLTQDTELLHQEHNKIRLTKGFFKVEIQRTFPDHRVMD